VVSANQLAVVNDLKRGGVNYGYNLATPLETSVPDRIDRKQLRAYETLKDAICNVPYECVPSSCLPIANLDAIFAALSDFVQYQRTSTNLEFRLSELRLADVIVRDLKLGDTIACSDYPFQPSFIIIEGLVSVRQLQAAPVDGATRKCVRQAVPLAVKSMFRRKTVTKAAAVSTMERSSYGDKPKVVAPQFPFCARVLSNSCLILVIDAAHVARWNEIVERARQSSAAKDMK
jgi:hypothetical protein